jgi:hypothetical protein
MLGMVLSNAEGPTTPPRPSPIPTSRARCHKEPTAARTPTAFIRHLERRHIVRSVVGHRGTVLYHVYSKCLYASLDETDNRN